MNGIASDEIEDINVTIKFANRDTTTPLGIVSVSNKEKLYWKYKPSKGFEWQHHNIEGMDSHFPLSQNMYVFQGNLPNLKWMSF